MNIHRLLTTAFLAVVFMAGSLQIAAEPQRTFGFSGTVDSLDRSSGSLVVEDRLFHLNESTRVLKLRGGKGNLSDITAGARIGFYPRRGDNAPLSEIWILPKNWKAQPGFALTPVR